MSMDSKYFCMYYVNCSCNVGTIFICKNICLFNYCYVGFWLYLIIANCNLLNFEIISFDSQCIEYGGMASTCIRAVATSSVGQVFTGTLSGHKKLMH